MFIKFKDNDEFFLGLVECFSSMEDSNSRKMYVKYYISNIPTFGNELNPNCFIVSRTFEQQIEYLTCKEFYLELSEKMKECSERAKNGECFMLKGNLPPVIAINSLLD